MPNSLSQIGTTRRRFPWIGLGVLILLTFCGARGQRRVALLLHVIWLPPSVIALMIPGFLV